MGLGLAGVGAGLALVLVAHDLPTLVLGGAIWSAGVGLVEHAARPWRSISRRQTGGAALATYTAAFQVANAAGALAWGLVIAAFGFEAALGGAVACVAVALLILRARWEQ